MLKIDKKSWNIDNIQKIRYTNICRAACNNKSAFDTFKQHKYYTAILEHCSYELGQEHYNNIIKNNPNLLTDYPDISVVSNLLDRFGSLDGFNIIEIGGGYGGQCKIICDIFSIKRYTIIDLPEASNLQNKYLKYFGLENKINTYSYLNGHTEKKYDLVISNYALSEVSKSLQIEYWKKILVNSNRGYLTCNKPIDIINFISSAKEIIQIKDIPGEHYKNYVVIWKNQNHNNKGIKNEN